MMRANGERGEEEEKGEASKENGGEVGGQDSVSVSVSLDAEALEQRTEAWGVSNPGIGWSNSLHSACIFWISCITCSR